jgi:hypothetical protein
VYNHFIACLVPYFTGTSKFNILYLRFCGPGSSDGIVTDCGLDGPGIETVGAGFSAPVQTGPGSHPAFCTMGTGSFPGGKLRPGACC